MTRSSMPLRRSLSSTPQGPTEVVHYDFVETSIGVIVVAIGDIRIVGMLIAQHPDYDCLIRLLKRHLPAATLTQVLATLKPWLHKVAAFVARSEPRVALPWISGVHPSNVVCGMPSSRFSSARRPRSRRSPPPPSRRAPYGPCAIAARARHSLSLTPFACVAARRASTLVPKISM